MPTTATANAARAAASRLRHLGLVAIPLLAVLGLLVFAAWRQASERAQYLTERRIRALATLAEQMEGEIDALDSAFKRALHVAHQNPGTKAESYKVEQRRKALRAVGGGVAIDSAESAEEVAKRAEVAAEVAAAKFAKVKSAAARAKAEAAAKFAAAARAVADATEERRAVFHTVLEAQLELVPMTLNRELPTDLAKPTEDDEAIARAVRLAHPDLQRLRQTSLQERTADAKLSFCHRPPWRKDAQRRTAAHEQREGRVRWFCGEKLLSDVMRPFISGSALESFDLFVVGESGEVLFRQGNSGLRLAGLLPSAPPVVGATPTPEPRARQQARAEIPALDDLRVATLVRDIDVDGRPYKLISQPLRLAGRGESLKTWAVGTLVPAHAAAGERARPPWLVVVGAPLVLLLALLALPLLKLVSAGAREPLTALTVLGIAFSLLVGTGVIIGGALALVAHISARERLDAEQTSLATAIQDSLYQELIAAHDALTGYRDARAADPADGYLSCTSALGAPVCTEDGKRSAPAHVPAPILDTYPLFDFLVLAGADGWQVEKWTPRDEITGRTDMSGYSAFRDARDRRLLRIAPGRALAVNVMTSPNTGKLLTVLSVPASVELLDAPRNGVQCLAATAADPNGWAGPTSRREDIAMISGSLAALSDPVLPADVSFAVIDDSGRVMFHSVERRRLYENFYSEASGDLELRAALFARRGEFLNIDYHGLPQRMLVRPLPNTPWSLLVLRERDPLTTHTVQIGAVVCLGVLALALLWSVWGAALSWLIGADARVTAWPDPRAVPRYRLLIAPLLAVAGWMALALGAAHADGTVRIIVIIVGPLLSLTLVLLALALGHARSAVRWGVGVAVLGGLICIATWLTWRLFGVWAALPWGGVVLLLAAVVLGWEASWLPDRARAATYGARLYAVVALLLLLNLSLLPAVGLVIDAAALGGETLVRARQIALAERLRRERDEQQRKLSTVHGMPTLARFWQRFERDHWREPGLRGFTAAARNGGDGASNGAHPADGVSRDVLELVHRVAPKACQNGACAAQRRHFTALAFKALPALSENTAHTRSLVDLAADDGSWRAYEAGGLELGPRHAVPADTSIELPGWGLGLQWPSDLLPPWLGLLAAALCAAGLWGLLRWVIAGLFSIDVREAATLDASIEAGVGRYLIAPLSATEAQLRDHFTAGDCIDLERVDPDALRACATSGRGPLLVLGLEHGIDDPAWNRRKLALLERLADSGRRLDIVSRIDVLGYVTRRLHSAADAADESYISPAELARWARLLARFDKTRADLPPAPLPPRAGATALLYDECRWTPRLRGIRAAIAADPRWTALEPAALVRHIGDCADAHYRTLWNLLTDEERLVLYHLAAHGLINPRTRDLARQLMRRGLIRRAPALRIMNKSFAHFVRSVEDRATIRGWERAAGASTWTWVRNGTIAVVVVGAIALFFTAPESYATWIAMLTALTTVGGVAAQLSGLLQGPRQGAAS